MLITTKPFPRIKIECCIFQPGVIFHQKGQLSDAIESYSRSIEIDPSNARAYYNRAISKLVIDNYKEALQDLEISKRLGYSKAAEVISQYY
ncbi:MAG: tetratricopeptide repeat protein [Butyricimonas faecalis]